MGQPLMDGRPFTNVDEEYVFETRVTFGTTSVASYKSKYCTFVRTNAGIYTLQAPKPYLSVIKIRQGWFRPSGATLEARIAAMDLTTGTFTIHTVVTAGTPTDPTSGDVLYLGLGVSENYLNDKYGG